MDTPDTYNYSQQPIIATAIPILNNINTIETSPTTKENNLSLFDNPVGIYETGTSSWVNDPAIENTANIFNQLDQMIAAVHTESNALDSMREKLKELDNMKKQLSSLTKRLLEADQANITCKQNLIKLQEEYSIMKKSKIEVCYFLFN